MRTTGLPQLKQCRWEWNLEAKTEMLLTIIEVMVRLRTWFVLYVHFHLQAESAESHIY